MYEIKVTLTDQQYDLLSDALFFYSEEKEVGNTVEELEDLIDSNSHKVIVERKFIRPEADCDI
tara:strand:+ start:655 stop:843 length:189 start_codon:yes stop_codon:yes gene_type:complete